jgi:hypothetical protein
LNNHFK